VDKLKTFTLRFYNIIDAVYNRIDLDQLGNTACACFVMNHLSFIIHENR